MLLFTMACGGGNKLKTAPEGDFRQVPFAFMGEGESRLADFEGQIVLIVNVASKCGFTHQYEGLQALQKRFEGQGFTVIGFPANNFLGQEPGSNEEILAFCRNEFDVSFPMAEKISVKGDDIHPLYQHLCSGLGDSELAGDISWNFNKFLLDRKGQLIGRYGSRTSPEDADLVSSIEKALERE
jgi:glutathione peroxidase